MAHEIESMAFVGETPWHKLGTYLGDQNVTSQVMCKQAKLDWNVVKVPTFYNYKDQQFRGDGFDMVREDTGKSLGHVGDRYTVFNNADAFQFMDSIIGAGKAVYHTAGSLMGGKRVWVLVDMKEKAQITPGDDVRNFILLSNSHDGSGSLGIGVTAIRVVCNNTLQMALNAMEKGEFFKLRHTKNISNKAIDASKALAAVSAKFKKFVEAGRLLAREDINNKELDEFLIRLELCRANERESLTVKQISEFKDSSKYHDLVHAFKKAPGAEVAGATLWGAVNAVTYYVDHKASSRLTDNFENQQEARLNSAFFNGGADKKSQALNLALELASKR